jgi:hypothetical protein
VQKASQIESAIEEKHEKIELKKRSNSSTNLNFVGNTDEPTEDDSVSVVG